VNALILMSRVPVAGKTKTRLIGPLTAQRAAQLHQCFLHDLSLMLSAANSELSLFVSYGDEGNPALLKAEIGLIRQLFDIDLIEDLARLQDSNVTDLLGPHLKDFLLQQLSLSYG